MGDYRAVRDLSTAIRAYGTATQRASKEMVNRASINAKRVLESELAAAVGSDGRMHNVGSKATKRVGGAKLAVSYDIKGINNPTGLIRAVGPWGLIENGSPAHEIIPKAAAIKGKGAKQARQQQALNVVFRARGAFAGRQPLRTPFGPRYRIQMPKVAGKQPWKKGWQRADPIVRRHLSGLLVQIVKEAQK